MKDLFDASFVELQEVLKKYADAVKRNDDSELVKLKQKHAELFTEEFRDYIREWLSVFGITNESLDKLSRGEMSDTEIYPIALSTKMQQYN